MDRKEALAIIAETISIIAECRDEVTEETRFQDVVNVGHEAILIFEALNKKGVVQGGTGISVDITPEYTIGDLLDDCGFETEAEVSA